MILRLLLALAALCWPALASSSDYGVAYSPLISLPTDEADRQELLTSLDAFLYDMATKQESSKYVESEHFTTNALFFDELWGFAASTRFESEDFYKSHLLSVEPHGDEDYVVQISQVGIPADGPAVFRMNFRMLARREGSRFRFWCLADQNQQDWRRQTVGNIDYMFRGTLNEKRARAFDQFNTRIATNLGVEPQTVTYVRCKDASEALGFLGIDYHYAANGNPRAAFNDGYHFITGFDEEGYEHDLLHVYFEKKFGREKTYRPFEEGIASYYAGSWGEPYQEILRQLREYLATNRDVDLRKAYDDKVKIGRHDIRYAINALLAGQIEQQHGFDALIDVLHCGKDGERFFEKLELHSGITEAGFAAAVRLLIESDL